MLRFSHIFTALLLMCVFSAFVIPRRSASVTKGIHVLLWPVSRPLGWIAGGVRGRVSPTISQERIDALKLASENLQLKTELAALDMQLKLLQARHAERERLGDVEKYCTSYSVMSPDTSHKRQVLKLSPKAALGTKEKDPVLYPPRGIAGRMMGGGSVQLVTDPGFRVTGSFGYFKANEKSGGVEWIGIPSLQPLVVGAGDGTMVVKSLASKAVVDAGLRVDHWVILNDSDPSWTMALQGWTLGKITAIRQSVDSPLNAEIRIQPLVNLMELQEVTVLNK